MNIISAHGAGASIVAGGLGMVQHQESKYYWAHYRNGDWLRGQH